MATISAVLILGLLAYLWLRAEYRLWQARQDVEILAEELSRLLPVKPKRKPGRRSFEAQAKSEARQMIADLEGGWDVV